MSPRLLARLKSETLASVEAHGVAVGCCPRHGRKRDMSMYFIFICFLKEKVQDIPMGLPDAFLEGRL